MPGRAAPAASPAARASVYMKTGGKLSGIRNEDLVDVDEAIHGWRKSICPSPRPSVAYCNLRRIKEELGKVDPDFTGRCYKCVKVRLSVP